MAFTDPSQSVPKEHSDLGPQWILPAILKKSMYLFLPLMTFWEVWTQIRPVGTFQARSGHLNSTYPPKFFFFLNISFGKNPSKTKTKNKDKIKKIKIIYLSACKLSSRLCSNSKIKTNLFTLILAWLLQANLSNTPEVHSDLDPQCK